MAFPENFPKSSAFTRDAKIQQSIEENEKKDRLEQEKESTSDLVSSVPRKKRKQEKKTYMTIYVSPSDKRILKKASQEYGYNSISELIRAWATALEQDLKK